MLKCQRCFGGVRWLDGAGPSPRNVRLIDSNALPLIQMMAQNGLQVDLAHFHKLETELTRDMERITEEVKQIAGQYVNLDSGDQVADLLFKKLGLKQARAKMTRSGDRESVEDAVLTAIQHEHVVVPKIQEFKEYSKLKGTYVQAIIRLARRVGHDHWRLYPNFKTTRVPSGRLACSDPNLLAMPTRTDRGRDIRRGFVAGPGYVYVSVDESAIEPRIAAHRSKDPALLRIFRNEEDIYCDFATSAYKLSDERYLAEGEEAAKLKAKRKSPWIYPTVQSDQRRAAKTCVLAWFYRVTAGGLLEQMPTICKNCKKDASKHTGECLQFEALWTEAMCQDLINAAGLTYPGVIETQSRDDKYAKRFGYMIDGWGRILHVTAVRSALPWVVNGALREVTNYPNQSSSQGTIKLTMAAVHHDLIQGGLQFVAKPLLQVHDELIFEVREDLAEEFGALVIDRFENCVRLDVPIKAASAIAPSWGDLPK